MGNNLNKLSGVLPSPSLPSNLSENAVWLAGEGAGSWFEIVHKSEGFFHISRSSPDGVLECQGIFKPENFGFDIEAIFTITYPSHCSKVTLQQDKRTFSFILTSQ
jgi:hypothetical protein